MKKIIIPIAVILLALVGFYFIYQKVNRSNGAIQPIYFVPNDAVYIIEAEEPIEAWKKVRDSETWQHLSTNKTFKDLSSGLNTIDQIMTDNQFVFDLLGNRKLLVSAHMYKHNDYDFLYLLDVENKLTTDFLEDIFKRVIDEKLYRVTKRAYNENSILELFDKQLKETIYISAYENILIASYQNALVENSLDEYSNPKIGRDINFVEVASKTDDSDYFKFYFNYKNLTKYASIFLEEDESMVNEISKSLFYSALSFDSSEQNLFSLSGYSGINDTLNTFLNALNKTGSGSLSVDKILPEFTSFYMSLGFSDFSEFIQNFENSYQKQDEEGFAEYKKNNRKIENFLGINLEKNFYSWIDDEITFAQLQAGGLGSKNEFAFCIKMNDIQDAKDNLEIIKKQIKRKTPGKFKSVDYKGYEINYLSIKDFFKALMGKFFEKLEKPYYVIIDQYVVFSNHPQTLRIFIDKFIENKTLLKDKEYQKFIKNYSAKNNVMCYINTSRLYSNLLDLSDRETDKSLQKNKPYITCFNQIGFQLKNDGNYFATSLMSEFVDPNQIEINTKLNFKNLNNLNFTTDGVETEKDLFEPLSIILEDFDVKKFEDYYPNEQLKVEVEIEDGIKNGWYKQYYENGEIMLKGHFKENLQEGIWKFYNQEGDLIEKRKFEDGKVVE